MSKYYDVEPRDPAVLGDGRSIGVNTATRSLDMPFPSTLAGLVRTRLGSGTSGIFDAKLIDRLLNQSLRGPLLSRVEPTPEIFVPAPADAVFFRQEGSEVLIRRRLRPTELGVAEFTDLEGLTPLMLELAEKAKAAAGPKYWTWAHFMKWLSTPEEGPVPRGFGLDGLVHEERVHVAVNSELRTVVDGALFQTDGVRYTRWSESSTGRTLERLALRFHWDGDAIPEGPVVLGGERRLSAIRGTTDTFPSAPKELVEQVTRTRRLRLFLLTPAHFDSGYRPRQFDGAHLVSCAVGRPAVVSGWDHANGGPKPTRRCAPAGSVYWLELDDVVTNVADWVSRHWFQNVSTAEQDRRDGFGLAVVGGW